MTNVKIYTTPTCHYCHMTKDYFNKYNIQYQEYDISKDDAARNRMIEVSGQMEVPVIDINGALLIGFDLSTLERLLEI